MSEGLVYLDGRLIPARKATISVLSPTVKYGINVFEGIRGYKARRGGTLALFRLTEHLVRLRHSMAMMGYGRSPSIEELESIVVSTVQANKPTTDIHVRLSAYILGDGFIDIDGPVALMCATAAAQSKPPKKRIIRAGVSSWRRIEDTSLPPRIKISANYANSRLAMIEARRHGYDEPILLTSNGKVAEAGAACIFVVRGGTLLTPGVTQGILESVTRDSLIRLAREVCGLRVEEREIDRTELLCADEAFLCGSAYEVTPIKCIDQITLAGGAPGPISQAVWKAYDQATRGALKKYSRWLTPV